ncbi:MAG TPA: type III-B CRISPR module-associated protein Cmr3 [Bacteroidetes bacterium]|nr:type III-B CRISPR module-associated protein Cmr3 [Bacteroidota bacterium]
MTSKSKTSLEFTALDTLFFKDGKPFSMGEETWARGIFPPFPSVIYGMMRSLWFAGNMGEFSKVRDKEDPTWKDLTLTRYLPAVDGATAFPIPVDLYQEKQPEMEGKALRFVPDPLDEAVIHDHPYQQILIPQKREGSQKAVKIVELGGNALLSKDEFKNYLAGCQGPFSFFSLDKYCLEEPKIGIGRDPATRTAKDGQLYRLAMRRLEGEAGKLSFQIQAEGLEFPEKGLSRLGAEGKAISYDQCSITEIECPLEEGDTTFLLYLATPAIFENGPVPAWFEKKGITVLGCANGRAAHIGGWDMKNRCPKPMYKAVPAGTLYFLEKKEGGITEELIRQLHAGNIYNLAPEEDDMRKAYMRQGFGQTYLGKYSPPQNTN